MKVLLWRFHGNKVSIYTECYHQITMFVTLRPNKHDKCISFIVKHLQSCVVYLHVYLVVVLYFATLMLVHT